MAESFTINAPNQLNGLILAGGESSRMGSDKSLLNFHGKPQRDHLFEMLSIFCERVFLSCKKGSPQPAHLQPLPDKFVMKSPLNGILTALSAEPENAWISVPVDMPFVDKKIVSFLIQHRDPTKVATCFYDSEGENPEPLLAIWEPKAYIYMIEFYHQGKTRPREFLQTHDVAILKSPDSSMHVNINSNEDFQNFMRERGHS